MVECILQNNMKVEIGPYDKSLAESLANNLFRGVSTTTVIQQREELLAPGPEEVYSVCAVADTQVVGICTGVRKRWFGERHRVEMVQIVVHEGFRGLGLAKCMMKEISNHFMEYGIEIVEISVESKNEPALHAYTKIGFKQYGLLENGLKYNGECTDEIFLSMKLPALLES